MRRMKMNNEMVYEYQSLINSVASTNSLSEYTLDNIARIGIYEGYNNAVVNCLYYSKYKYEYIQMSLANQSEIPYNEDIIRETIELNIEKFLKNKNIFLRLRAGVCNFDYKTIMKYDFLFDEVSPLITEEELYLISGKAKNDLEILKFIKTKLVTTNDTDFLAEFFNRKYHTNTEAYNILLFISNLKSDISYQMFYSINFEKLQYFAFSRQRKSFLKTRFKEILNLSDNFEKIKFLKATLCTDTSWELELLDELILEKNLADAYVESVNSARRVSVHTLYVLNQIPTRYRMSDTINEMFINNNYYEYFIISTTLKNRFFDYEFFKNNDNLMTASIKIFKELKYKRICEHMIQNHDFLYDMQDAKEYVEVSKDVRMQFVDILQDSESLKNIMSYGENFALEYLLKIQGFKDYEAAKTFIDIVLDNDLLKSSQALYDHTHEKLLNSSLKFKYTMCRKRI